MPVWEWFYNCYFRVKTSGWHHIPDEKVLFVGSHSGGLATPDMSMMMYDWYRRFGTERPIYGLMHPVVWQVYTPLAQLAVQAGAIRAHPKMAIAALQQGASVLVYPGGAEDVFRPHWEQNKIHFAGRKGFIKLALREKVPIVPTISYGSHDTLFVFADCYDLIKQLEDWGMPKLIEFEGTEPRTFPIYLGLPWILGIGPLLNFPLPAQIHTRICKPIIFEDYGRKAAQDRAYVDQCYERVFNEMQAALYQLEKEVKKF